MSQTSYAEQPSAMPGMKAYAGKGDQVLSYNAEVDVPFGHFVCVGTDKNLQAKLPVAAGDVTDQKLKRGVALQQHTIEQSYPVNSDPLKYAAGKEMSVLTRGQVYMVCEEAMSVSDPVYVVFSGAGKGKIRNDDGVTPTAALLADARVLKDSVTVDGVILALVELL